jgi:hypothetical protein
MNVKTLLPGSAAGLLVVAACIVPPAYERASWGPPPDYWQSQGRYRPAEDGGQADPRSVTERALDRTDPMREGAPERPAPDEPLYAWDGGVVSGAPQGRVAEQEGTPRGLETPPAGRMHIIELYQQVLDERDALTVEVEHLREELEQTKLALQAKTVAAEELTSRVSSLEAAHQALLADNQAIAARLVQAQIRRLEAEKMLLEARIESERAKAEESARAAAATGKPGAARTKPGEPKAEPKDLGGGHE